MRNQRTFGIKLALAYAEFDRCRARLVAAREEIATCAISGAIGTFANIDPSVEQYVADKLGLNVEPVSTQVIPRDRHAMYFATLGVIASCVERLAVEIRHLQRTEECLKLRNSFPKGKRVPPQCPHKTQPNSDRKPHGPFPLGARHGYPGSGKCGPVA